jgi:hypothetical protein
MCKRSDVLVDCDGKKKRRKATDDERQGDIIE